ncbi:MAG: PASTA domain-containing protein [Ruminococcus sp.]|nr:PASTA domain-containing protein [Ruminococcus sp.]
MKTKLKIIIPAVIAIAAVITAVLTINFTPGEETDFSSLMNLAQNYLIENNYEQAIAEFEKIIELDPMNADAYLGIAEAYEALGDREKALEWLEKGYEATGDERIKSLLDELNKPTDTETEITTTTPSETTADESSAYGKIMIPDLSGLSKDEAVIACENAGIKYSISESNNSSIEKDYVISQQIPAGSEVDERVTLIINISLGIENTETTKPTTTTSPIVTTTPVITTIPTITTTPVTTSTPVTTTSHITTTTAPITTTSPATTTTSAVTTSESVETEVLVLPENITASNGEITVRLFWETHDDLDVHIYTPDKSHISYWNKKAGGGELDVDMNRNSAELTNNAVENVFFPEPDAGHYIVFIQNYCDRTENTSTEYKVSISLKGKETIYKGKIDKTGTEIIIAEFNNDEGSYEYTPIGAGVPVDRDDRIKDVRTDEYKIEMLEGDALTLNCWVVPDKCDQTVVFRASNPECVSVSSDGTIYAHKAGKATITILAAAKAEVEKEITISVLERIKPNSITMGEVKMKAGETGTIMPFFSPVNTTLKDVIWTVEDESIAEIDENDMFTAKQKGETYGTVTSKHNSEATCKFKIIVE